MLSAEASGPSPAFHLAPLAWQAHLDAYHPPNGIDWEEHRKTGREIVTLLRHERPDLLVAYGGAPRAPISDWLLPRLAVWASAGRRFASALDRAGASYEA